MPDTYCGRFAPSPSGPLHFGSLVAAVGSYLDAKTQGGRWLIRLEDVDAPRTVPGAAERILRTLEAFGFEWDGEIVWQSRRHEAYAAALQQLRENGLAYGCACSRREIGDSALQAAIDGGRVYPGTCRNGLPPDIRPRAWRLRTRPEETGFEDRLQGRIVQQLERDVGDFVLLRADGQYAYQLAVVVDDAAQGITDIVRGADLLDSTPRQIWLQHCLGLPTPRYAHLPVVCNAAGEKLSKQTRAPALDPRESGTQLRHALAFLGQELPPASADASLSELWNWARTHWQFERIPHQRAIAPGDQRPSSSVIHCVGS